MKSTTQMRHTDATWIGLFSPPSTLSAFNKNADDTSKYDLRQVTMTSLLDESFVIGLFCFNKVPELISCPEFLLREGSAEEKPTCLPSSSPITELPEQKHSK